MMVDVAQTLRSIVEQLATVVGTEELVRIRRGIRKADRLEGFVVGVGERWVLLHVLNPDMFLDGYAALRLKDIRRVESRGGADSFPLRALRHFGESPRTPEAVSLDTIQGVLSSLADGYPLLTIHVERLDPEVCYIGKFVKASNRSLHLLEIRTSATWDKTPTKWPLKEITRIEVGGRYPEALHAIGGEPNT
jgi:hypothetical protein